MAKFSMRHSNIKSASFSPKNYKGADFSLGITGISIFLYEKI